ncbi:MAG: stage II sporulation protein P [Clostridia bacterium]|nr:stage II sporulation protein P [Clostridia bacterium]
MFNVKVFRVKDLIKYFIEIIIVIGIIFLLTKTLSQNKNEAKVSEQENKSEGFLSCDLIGCIDTASGIIKETNKPEDDEIKAYKPDFFEDILKSQIGSIEDFGSTEVASSVNSDGANNSQNSSNEANSTGNSEDEKSGDNIEVQAEAQTDVKLAQTGLKTEVITNNPLSLNYNAQYGKVKIKNETSHELTEEMLNPDISINNKNILLFHTHTCESYTSSQQYPYTPTGNYRTTDLNFTVARVGTELENHLKSYGYNVIHDTTYHDYPSYNGSYTHSLATVQNILKDNPTDVIFDVHRDAIGSRSDYAPCVKIGEDVAAQIMFVVGSDEGGLWHPNWNQNLKFAVKIQAKAEEMYPGLFKPITLTKYRYNQHCGKYASIIEVGATGNTMEQCLNSMKYLAKVIDEVIK